MSAPSPQKLTTNDALTFLKAVKDKFHDNRAKYDEFLEVMRDYNSARIDTVEVIIRAKTLFNGYPELIPSFNAFLPKGFAIKIQDVDSDKKPVDFMEAQKLTTNDAATYLKTVKDKFHDNRAKYDEFLEVMRDFKCARIDTTGVIIRVKTLFNGYPELITGFNAFLPKGFAIKIQDVDSDKKPVDIMEAQKLTTNDALTYVKTVKDKFHDNRAKYDEFLEVMRDFKCARIDTTGVIIRVKTLFNGYPELIPGFNAFLPKGFAIKLQDVDSDKKPMDFMEAQKLTTNDALTYVRTVKDKFHDNRAKYDEFLEVMRDFKCARIDTTGVIIRVKTLFNGYPELIPGFNAFLPKGFAIKLQDLDSDKKPVDFMEAISFINKVKACFQHKEAVYKAFLGILNMYRMHNKSIQDVYKEVTTLFRDHPDLLEEFRLFLPDTCTAPQVLTIPKVKQDDDKAQIPPVRNVQSIKRERPHPSTCCFQLERLILKCCQFLKGSRRGKGKARSKTSSQCQDMVQLSCFKLKCIEITYEHSDTIGPLVDVLLDVSDRLPKNTIRLTKVEATE